MRPVTTFTVVAFMAVVIGVGVDVRVVAQAQASVAGQRASGAAPTPAPQARGRSRGRVSVSIMSLEAPWSMGATIPEKYSQAGDEVSPLLRWDKVPDGVASFVLLAHDVSAPVGQGMDDVLHWMVWNIPAAARQLPEGVPQGPDLPDGSRQISVTGPYYRGPAAPASGPAHVYLFELYALDTMLDVSAVAPGMTVAQTRAAVTAAMGGHVRGKGVTAGTFRRKSGQPAGERDSSSAP